MLNDETENQRQGFEDGHGRRGPPLSNPRDKPHGKKVKARVNHKRAAVATKLLDALAQKEAGFVRSPVGPSGPGGDPPGPVDPPTPGRWDDDEYTKSDIVFRVPNPQHVRRVRGEFPWHKYRRCEGIDFLYNMRHRPDIALSLVELASSYGLRWLDSPFNESFLFSPPRSVEHQAGISLGPVAGATLFFMTGDNVFGMPLIDYDDLDMFDNSSIYYSFTTTDFMSESRVAIDVRIVDCPFDAHRKEKKFESFRLHMAGRLESIPRTREGSMGYLSGIKWAAKEHGLDYTKDLSRINAIAQQVWDDNKPTVVCEPDLIDEVSKNGFTAKTAVRMIPGSFRRGYLATLGSELVSNVTMGAGLAIDALKKHLGNVAAGKFRPFSLGSIIYSKCTAGMNSKKPTGGVSVDVNVAAILKNKCQDKPYAVEMLPRIDMPIDVPGNCICNAVQACETRCLTKATGQFDIDGYRAAIEMYFKYIDWSLIASIPLPDVHWWIEQRPWPQYLKRRAHTMWDEYLLFEVDTRGVALSFSKVEIFLNKLFVDPRFIQGRTMMWVLLTGPMVWAFKMRLKGYTSNPDSFCCVAPTMSSEDVGLWYTNHRDYGSHITSSDASSYDSTHRFVARLAFHQYLLDLVPEITPEAESAFRDAWRVRGSMLRTLAKFTSTQDFPLMLDDEVPMGSGDTRTSDENSFLRAIDTIYEFEPYGLRSCIVAGDDNLAATMITPDPLVIRQRGLAIGRIEKVAEIDERVVFLQKFFVRAIVHRPTGPRAQFVPALRLGRVMSKIGVVKTSISAKKRKGVLKGCLLGHLAQYSWQPIISQYCHNMLQNLGGVKERMQPVEAYSSTFTSPIEATHETIEDMAHYYTVEPSAILSCADYSASVRPDQARLDHFVFERMYYVDVGEPEGDHASLPFLRYTTFSVLSVLWALSVGPFVEELMKSFSFWFYCLSFALLECQLPHGATWARLLGAFVYRLVGHYWLATRSTSWLGCAVHHFLLNWLLVMLAEPIADLALRSEAQLLGLVRNNYIGHTYGEYLRGFVHSLCGRWSIIHWRPRLPARLACPGVAMSMEQGVKSALVFTNIPNCSADFKYRIIGFQGRPSRPGWLGWCLNRHPRRSNRKQRKSRMLQRARGQGSQALIIRPAQVVRPRPKRASRRRRGRRGLSQFALAKVNPFLPECCGVRCPDQFGFPTATALLRAQQGISQYVATGFAAWAFSPLPQYFTYNAASISGGGTITWTGGALTAYPQQSNLAQLASVARAVGGGLRITVDSALTATSGHLWIAHIPADVWTSLPWLGFPTTEAQMASFPLSEKFSLVELSERPLIVPFKAFDDGVYRFRDPNNSGFVATTNNLESSFGWATPVLFAVGMGTSSINVEVISHIEFIQDGATLYSFIDVAPCPYQPQQMIMASQVEAMAPVGTLETVISTVESAAVAAGRLVRAGSSVASAFSRMGAFAGKLASARGFFRSPANNAVPMIEYNNMSI